MLITTFGVVVAGVVVVVGVVGGVVVGVVIVFRCRYLYQEYDGMQTNYEESRYFTARIKLMDFCNKTTRWHGLLQDPSHECLSSWGIRV